MKKAYKECEGMVVLDFYDGVTEGFALSLGSPGPVYFKMLAWDADQDERLFAVVIVPLALYERLFRLVGSLEWPVWDTLGESELKDIEKIVKDCRTRLISEGNFFLGPQLECSAQQQPIGEIPNSKFSRALRKPADLEEWLTLLKAME